jgi:hypothetical protein
MPKKPAPKKKKPAIRTTSSGTGRRPMSPRPHTPTPTPTPTGEPLTIPWRTPDGWRLTIADLKDITSRAVSVISVMDAVEHKELIAELQAIGLLCDVASMTAGELYLPAK